MFRSLLINPPPHCPIGEFRERKEFVTKQIMANDQVRAKPRSPHSKSVYPLIRLKLRLVKYCTKVYANRRNHSYPYFLPSPFTSLRDYAHLSHLGSITFGFPLSFPLRKRGARQNPPSPTCTGHQERPTPPISSQNGCQGKKEP